MIKSGRAPQAHRQYVTFQGILDFVGRQLVASSVMFSELPIDFRRKRAYSVANVLLGNVVTQLR